MSGAAVVPLPDALGGDLEETLGQFAEGAGGGDDVGDVGDMRVGWVLTSRAVRVEVVESCRQVGCRRRAEPRLVVEHDVHVPTIDAPRHLDLTGEIGEAAGGKLQSSVVVSAIVAPPSQPVSDQPT